MINFLTPTRETLSHLDAELCAQDEIGRLLNSLLVVSVQQLAADEEARWMPLLAQKQALLTTLETLSPSACFRRAQAIIADAGADPRVQQLAEALRANQERSQQLADLERRACQVLQAQVDTLRERLTGYQHQRQACQLYHRPKPQQAVFLNGIL